MVDPMSSTTTHLKPVVSAIRFAVCAAISRQPGPMPMVIPIMGEFLPVAHRRVKHYGAPTAIHMFDLPGAPELSTKFVGVTETSQLVTVAVNEPT